jgi:hypothetical protein
MAQLRDAVTSELIAEGTPLEVVVIARQFNPDDVVFDGVEGEHTLGTFDPDAVVQAHDDRIGGLSAAIEGERDPTTKRNLKAALRKAQTAVADAESMAGDARERLETARDRADV